MFEILSLEARPFILPLQSPFETARRRQTAADNVLYTVRLSNGIVGHGEASPAEYVTGETPAGVLADATLAEFAITGADARRVRRWADRLREALPHSPTACSAVEMAVLDALSRSWEVPLSLYFGGAADCVRTDLTIPITPPETAAQLAAEAASRGFRSLKVKVGGPDREEDFRRVFAMAAAAPGVGLRVDANQAFDVDGALDFATTCARRDLPLELMEQPLPAGDWEGMAALTRRCPCPVIADEMVVDPAAAARVARDGAAHGVNIKVAKAGLLGALDIIAIARAAGLKLMLGCMMESLPGIGAAVHLAAGTGAFDFLDLDGHMLIGIEAPGRPFGQRGDELTLDGITAGIGWSPPET